MAGTAPVNSYEGICDLPLNMFGCSIKTRYFPSVIVFTMTLGWYYICGLFSQGGTTALYGLIPFFFILLLGGVQGYVIMKQPQCPPVPWWGVVGAAVIGILCGAIGWIGAKKGIEAAAAAAAAATSSNAPKPPKKCPDPANQTYISELDMCFNTSFLTGNGVKANGFTNYVSGSENFANMQPGAVPVFTFSNILSANTGISKSVPDMLSSSSGEKCTAPSANSDQTFVVDLYKNGKLITQAIGE